MRPAAIIVSLLAFVIALVWLIKAPGYDSAVALAGSLAALITSFFLKRGKDSLGQKQDVNGGSVGVQAGRDANFRDIKK